MKKPRKHICEVIDEVAKFPPHAFEFVQEGLTYAVQDTHGEMSDAQRRLQEFMFTRDLDIDQFEGLYAEGKLPSDIHALVSEAGGMAELNRHVSGERLCWGLRDYALERWGALATTVLRHWNIRQTRDFGEIVFALVDSNYLQKQPQDSIEDFEDVFEFEEALERCFRIELQPESDALSSFEN